MIGPYISKGLAETTTLIALFIVLAVGFYLVVAIPYYRKRAMRGHTQK